MLTIVLLIAGLALLTIGGEALVRGSSRLAALCGISTLVIGLTVVAFGTSAPELAVSVMSAYAGQTVRVHVGTYNDGNGLRSAMYVDDVSLGASP